MVIPAVTRWRKARIHGNEPVKGVAVSFLQGWLMIYLGSGLREIDRQLARSRLLGQQLSDSPESGRMRRSSGTTFEEPKMRSVQVRRS
jgi:hypothetical protein